MRKLLIIIVAILGFSAVTKVKANTISNPTIAISSYKAWYSGGNLHQKKIRDWKRATYANKLATCADFVCTYYSKIKKVNITNNPDLFKKQSVTLLSGLNSFSESNESVIVNSKVSEIAMALSLTLFK